MSKRELVKRLAGFYNKCLRLVRTYNFDSTFVEQARYYYEYLFKSQHFPIKKVLDMRYYFSTCFQKMSVKAEMDLKLIDNEVFHSNFALFKALYAEVETQANDLINREREQRFLAAEDNNRIRKYVKSLENNIVDMKTFRRYINLIHQNF